MKYAVQMGSSTMIYVQGFLKIGSGVRKLLLGGGARARVHTHTHTHRSHKFTFIFSR
jgi:hypothetical protein